MFELDSDTGELRKEGKSRPRIRDQALQILIMLLEKSDEVVSRDELRERLWASDTFVDFDHGLNTAIISNDAGLLQELFEQTGTAAQRSNCVCLIASVLFICVTLTCSACLLHHSVEPTKHLCGHDQP